MKRDSTLIHPQLRKIARSTPPIIFTRRNLGIMRLLTRLKPPSKLPQDVLIENIFIPAQANQPEIRLRVYKPILLSAPTPALLWHHGGGYITGNPQMDDQRCAHFVSDLGITVISVDYRLAPEYPFPCGLEDSITALNWLTSQAHQLNIDPQRIAIGGGSAGAGLAAAVAQLAYDRNAVQPVFQLLLYPMLDDRTTLRTDLADSNHLLWNQRSNHFGWEAYLGKHFGTQAVPAYAVPARRADLSGLPPAWIGIGTLDLFYDEALIYAQRLKDAAVACEVKTVAGAFHGFDVFDATLPVVQDFYTSQITAIKHYLFDKTNPKGTP